MYLFANSVRCLMSPRVAICFLVVNKMEVLPEISITSAFDRTHSEIILGYLNQDDLPRLRPDVSIKTLHLENLTEIGLSRTNDTYSDFSEDDFYKIVQLKWQLLEKTLGMGYDFVVYSDTDVYWNLNPLPELLEIFSSREEVAIQIQSFTDLPSHPKLCMGFVAFRNSSLSRDFLQECRERHSSHAADHGRIGDDDIVTEYYKEKNFPRYIQELPQSTFPVGRMLKLYAKNSKYPGLPSPQPFIFHANYVVGLRNKIILMKIFISKYSAFDKGLGLGIEHLAVLLIQRFRLKLGRIKSLMFK